MVVSLTVLANILALHFDSLKEYQLIKINGIIISTGPNSFVDDIRELFT